MNTKQKVLLFLAQTTYKLHDWMFAFMARTGLILFGSSGGGGGPTNTTTTTSNIPEYARPYFERLMNRTEAVSNDGYVPYGGARVQGFSPAQQEGMSRITNMQAPTQIRDATNLTSTAAQGALANGGFNSGFIGSTYNPRAVGPQMGPRESVDQAAPRNTYYQAAPRELGYQAGPRDAMATYDPGEFNSSVARKYMSPYQQLVTDIAKREATREFGQANVARDSQAAQRGSFGGSRAALVQAEAARNHGQRLDDIQTKGSQAAFDNAQQQYERDRAQQYNASNQRLDAGKFNSGQDLAYGNQRQQADQFNSSQDLAYGAQRAQIDQFNSGQDMNYAQLRQQNAHFNSGQDLAYGNQLQQNAQFNEASRQRAAELGLQGQTANEAARAAAAGIRNQSYGLAGQMAGQLGDLGKTQQQLDMERANAVMGVGSLQQQQGQKALDVAYDDFVNQRDYDKNQLNFYSGVLRGVPTGVNSDVVTRQAAQNPVSQIAGLGIAGLGAYNAMK